MSRAMSVFVNIGAKVGSSVNASASATERRFGQMNRRLRTLAAETSAHLAASEKRWGSMRRNAQDFAMGVSVPMAGLASVGARSAYEWAKVGNELQAVTQMTDNQRKAVERAARAQIGSPVENLRAGLDLARTGFDADQIGAALPIAVRLAKSDPSVDSESAADIVTNVMKGMRLEIEEMGRAADILAFAASKSSTNVRLMGESFKYTGPIAARLGSSMEDVAAASMTMADAGIKGSEAGVAMRSMFVRMVKPTKASAATLSSLGVDISKYVSGRRQAGADDVVAFMAAQGINAQSSRSGIADAIASGASGAELYRRITDAIVANIEGGADAVDRDAISSGVVDAMSSAAEKVDFIGFMEELERRGASAAQIATIFDQRQGSRLMTLMSQGDLRRNRDLVANGAPGWLQKMFATSTKGIVGSVGRLAQSLGGLVITLSETGVIDTAANAIDSIARGISNLGKTNPALLKFGTYAALGVATLAPLGWVLGGVASAFRLLGGGLQMAWKVGGPILTRLGPPLMRLIGLSGRARGMFMALRLAAMVGLAPLAAIGWPVIAVIAGLALALGWVVSKWNGIKAFFEGFAKGFRENLSPETITLISNFGSKFKEAIGLTFKPVKDAWEGIKTLFDWISKLFAPANAVAWGSSGESFGLIIGKMADGVLRFQKIVIDSIGRVRELFGMGGGPMPSPGGGAPVTRQRGGGIGRSGLALVGERGPELFAPGRSGTVIPARTTAALLAAMTAGVPATAHAGGDINASFTINGVTDPRAVADTVLQQIKVLAGREARAGLHD